ncbi:CPXCG motif-containing cysteine-rich protein [Haloferula sp.]|uniref:CPXCG motif-containing cysteine-rich protein n=1 Tax=Haloferula sp. TaxID=2497595 RepID=UPI0032A01CC9
METVSVQCPTCFEFFEVASPAAAELPAELDYDCEICCRPMVILIDSMGARAMGLGD